MRDASHSRRKTSARRFAEPLEPRTFLSAGDLDPTFGTGGVVFPGRFDYPTVASATAVAFAPDGKLLVSGVARGAVSAAAVIARFNPDGSPDLTFDGDGKVVFPDILASDTRQSGALAVQADGKVVMAAGQIVVRLNVDGSPDGTFGSGGRSGVTFHGTDITEMVIQPDGKIVVAGASDFLRTARFHVDNDPNTQDGFPDSSFDGGTTNLPASVEAAILTDLAILPNGKIAATLIANPGNATQHGLVARFNANGGIDNTFDDDGFVPVNVPGPIAAVAQGAALAVQGLPDNRLAVGGATAGGYYVARYRVDGRTDPTFGTDGFVFTPYPPPDLNTPQRVVRQMEFAADGRLLAAGPAPESDAPPVVVVRRFLADGTTDASFGTAGEARTPVGGNPRATELAVAGDGSVAVAVSGPTNGPKQFTAVRYTPAGQPDPASTNGIVSATFVIPGQEPRFQAVAEAAGGKLIAAGNLISGLSNNPLLARFNPDGSLDPSFGNGGWSVVFVPGFPQVAVNEVLVLTDGRIVVGGSVQIGFSPERHFLVARFTADGVPDPTFSVDGFVTTGFGPGAGAFVNDIALDAAGRVVAAGLYRPEGGGQTQFAAARYNADGSPDSTFSGDGMVITNVGTGGDVAYAVTILSDGGILLGGEASDVVGDNRPAWAFVKYRPDGTLDPAFGNQPGDPGVALAVPAERGGVVNDLVAREGGRFYAAGTASFVLPGTSTETTDLAVGAFTAVGTPVASFGGGDGIALAGFADRPTRTEVLTARLGRQADGKLVISGTVGASAVSADFAVARFTAAGALDTTFSQDGRVATDLSNDYAWDMTLLPDGRVVLVGWTHGARAVLLRYQGDSFSGLSNVYVRGSAWSGGFKTYVESQGLGDDVLGYRVNNSASRNESILPWVNVDEIVLRYGAPPTGGGIPSPGSVTLDGVRSDYTVTSVTSLDPQTYVLRLDRPLGNQPGGGQNGDSVRLGVAGAGSGGESYVMTLNVLQGDVNLNAVVVASDASDVTPRFFRSTTAPGPAGPTQYTVFHDVDASGTILANDFSLVKARFFDNLPTPPAGPALRGSSVTSDLFCG